jgi:hypothetical protein
VQVAVFDTDMLVVNCGRFIKYGRIDASMFDDDMRSDNAFTDLAIDFGKNVEISKIVNTNPRHRIQIVAKDLVQNVLIIVTWDLESNTECSMY